MVSGDGEKNLKKKRGKCRIVSIIYVNLYFLNVIYLIKLNA